MATISDKNAALRRRQSARLEMIANNLRLKLLLEPTVEPPPDGYAHWNERPWIERRNEELRAIIDETYQVSNESYTA